MSLYACASGRAMSEEFVKRLLCADTMVDHRRLGAHVSGWERWWRGMYVNARDFGQMHSELHGTISGKIVALKT